jgi:hypothetical protein
VDKSHNTSNETESKDIPGQYVMNFTSDEVLILNENLEEVFEDTNNVENNA